MKRRAAATEATLQATIQYAQTNCSHRASKECLGSLAVRPACGPKGHYEMNRILDAQSAIYDQFQHSSAFSAISKQRDQYAAYYTSMYLIQDTGEALARHMAGDFSTDPLRAYLEFWGVMQAINIQQDAISELHRVVGGSKPTTGPNSAWCRLRDKRNLCAGHPARRSHGVPAIQRAFMGRNFGNYHQITYELWDDGIKQTTNPAFNLRQMIEDYVNEAGQILRDVLTTMKSKWP
jgi:hypothetical protein